MAEEKKLENLLKKISKLKEGEKLDLSANEDLVIGIMNLISIEEHLFFTAKKTGQASYLNLLNETRELRKKLLKKIVKDYEGEVWCISKHLLAGTMRLMEVGTKYLGMGKKAEAEEYFNSAYSLWNLFWGLNLKIISKENLPVTLSKDILDDSGNIKPALPENLEKEETLPKDEAVKSRSSFFSKLASVVQKAIDCCKE